MPATIAPALERIVTRAKDEADVLAVVLFGSQARGDAHAKSDVDVCLVLVPGVTRTEAGRRQLDYLAIADADIAIYQTLPLYIRVRVLREGRVLFVRDEDALYGVAIRTVREWERFRPIYRAYLDEVARG